MKGIPDDVIDAMNKASAETVTLPDPKWVRELKVGDTVTRVLAGIPLVMIVTEVHETLVVCDVADHPLRKAMPGAELWTFDRDTGMEVDHDLRWGPEYGTTGSFLVPPAKQ